MENRTKQAHRLLPIFHQKSCIFFIEERKMLRGEYRTKPVLAYLLLMLFD
jgi:hypothetical protein